MSEQKVSVVIPYYNDSQVLNRTIESVLSQTYKVYEIIIIDDCSDDSKQAQDMIRDYPEEVRQSIKYIRNDTNLNGAYSRNLGIKRAGGEIVALLDADDFWERNHVELSVKELIDSKVAFVYSNILRLSQGVDKVKVSEISEFENKFDILFFSPPQTNSFVFDRAVFLENEIWFNEKLRRHQDWQFFITILKKGIAIKYLDQYTSYYCDSHRPKSTRVNYDSMLDFWDENRDLFDKKLMQNYLRKIVINIYVDQGSLSVINYLKKYEVLYFVKSDYFLRLLMASDKTKKIVPIKFIFYLIYFRNEILSKVKNKFLK